MQHFRNATHPYTVAGFNLKKKQVTSHQKLIIYRLLVKTAVACE